jgi:retron-type reverse transcriptase
LVIEPIFEADFQPCSYGFRPKKSATQALEAIREAGNRGHSFVVNADIQGYFDSIVSFRQGCMNCIGENW